MRMFHFLAWVALLPVIGAPTSPAIADESGKSRTLHVFGGGPLHIGNADHGIVSLTKNQLTTVGYHYAPPNSRAFIAQFRLPSGAKTTYLEVPCEADEIADAAGSRDGSLIVLSYDGKLDLRSTIDLAEPLLTIPLSRTARAVAVSPRGRTLIASFGLSVAQYDCYSGNLIDTVRVDDNDLRPSYDDAGKAYLIGDQHIWLWEAGKQPRIYLDAPEGREIKHAVIKPDATYLLSDPPRKGSQLFADLATGEFFIDKKLLSKFDTAGSQLWQRPMPDGAFAVRGDEVFYSREYVLYRVTATEDPERIGLSESLSELKFSPDGQTLVGSENTECGFQVWDTQSWKPHAANALPFDNRYSAGINDDGTATVTSVNHILTAKLGEPLQVAGPMSEGHTNYWDHRSFSGDGAWLATINQQGEIAVVNQQGDKKEIGLELPESMRPKEVQLNRDGSRMLVGYSPPQQTERQAASRGFLQGFLGGFGGPATMKTPTDLFEIPTGKRLATLDTGDIEIACRPYFPSATAGIAYRNSSGVTWKAIPAKGTPKNRKIWADIWDVKLSDSGSLVIGQDSGRIVWYESIDTAVPQTLLDAGPDARLHVEISPNGETVYAIISDGDRSKHELIAINVATKLVLWRTTIPQSPVWMQLSPGGKYLLVPMGQMQWVVIAT